MTEVVNRHYQEFDVYIGRGSIWGNPHKMKNEAGRAYCIMLYRKTLWKKIQSGEITKEMLLGLDGKRLGCYCAPKRCHGDVIIKAIEWAKGENSCTI